jgi:hypothetical protein
MRGVIIFHPKALKCSALLLRSFVPSFLRSFVPSFHSLSFPFIPFHSLSFPSFLPFQGLAHAMDVDGDGAVTAADLAAFLRGA